MAQQRVLLSSTPLRSTLRLFSTNMPRKGDCLRHARQAGQLRVGARSAQQTLSTVEGIYLLSFPEEFAQDAGPAAVDSIWSLQYLVPGTLCGAAGPVSEVPIAGLQRPQLSKPPQQQQPSPQQAQQKATAPNVTHAVLLRFSNNRSLEAFQHSPKSHDVLAKVLDGGCHGLTMLSVTTQLPNNLEALFRRGGDFDVGFELLAALQLQEDATSQDAAEVLGLLQRLAESSAFGAVQAIYGPCSAVLHQQGPADVTGQPAAEAAAGGGGSSAAGAPFAAADYVLMARFQMQEQLQDFLNCPPVAALLKGDARLPLRAVWAGVMEIAPTEKSQSSSQGKGRLLQ